MKRDEMVSASAVREGGLRATAAQIALGAIYGMNTYDMAKRLVGLEKDRLIVDEAIYDLSQYRKIYVVGAGKASLPIARALDEILGDRIELGLVICKEESFLDLEHIKLATASHPIPDERSLAGGARILEIVRGIQPNSLVISCFTGGSSALVCAPIAGIELADKQALTEILLSCGANIFEINAVRKHISAIKGGRLLAEIPDDVPVVNLTVSDVVGDALDYITDLTVPDTSTFADARETLDKFGLWGRIPISIQNYFHKFSPDKETPKAGRFRQRSVQTVTLASNTSACEKAAQIAKSLGFEPLILSTQIEGESAEAARFISAITRESWSSGRPIGKPGAIISGGETTVRVAPEEFGRGGPNQEFALAAAIALQGLEEVGLAAIDTDGTDGPTRYAGAAVDGSTVRKMRDRGIDPLKCLAAHRSSEALGGVGALLDTGPTGTNVNDLRVVLVS